MKELLAIISLLVSGAVAEPPAPYPASGWRPSGPAFELPQRGQAPQKQEYLPPVDPRNPSLPPVEYGSPDVSVQGLPPQEEQRPLFQASPINGQQFSGPDFNKDLRNLDQSFKEYQYQQQQARYRELQRQRELEAAQAASNTNRLPAPQNPRQFARTTTTTTEASTTLKSSPDFDQNQEDNLKDDKQSEKLRNGKVSVEVTKQKIQEYPGEFFLGSLAQIRLQPNFVAFQPISGAYVQAQGAEKQEAGFDAATHFSALPSVLAQQQNLQPQNQALFPNDQQVLVQQPAAQYQPSYQPQVQPQQGPIVLQAPAQFQPNYYAQPNPNTVAVQPQYQPAEYQPVNSYQPALQPNPDAVSIQPQYQPQPQGFQIQAQQVIYEPNNQLAQPAQFAQPGQFPSQFPQPSKDAEETDDDDQDDEERDNQENRNNKQLYQQPIIVQQNPGQFVREQPQYYQPQVQYLQPQEQYLQPAQLQALGQFSQPQFMQGQFVQPQGQFVQPQSQFVQPQGQFVQPQGQFVQPQGQFFQPQGQFAQPQGQPQTEYIQPQGQYAQQNQDALQSGLDINQEGNDIDQNEDKDEQGATAVATAFGTRTQPRVQPQYGVPFPVPRVQANPSLRTTTESAVEELATDGPEIAQATAVANEARRGEKSARLRSRRIRPVYAVDRSGRLVFAEA